MAAADEFELIARYFDLAQYRRADVIAGIGDDAAIVNVEAGDQLVTACDTLIEQVHFPAGFTAEQLACRALAVNLSDFAAMSATPRWMLLALTLPAADSRWLEGFGTALAEQARRYGIVLVGGDTTRGPLSVTLTVLGTGRAPRLLRRNAAVAGDELWVSGELGAAAAGLQLIQQSTPGFAPSAAQVSGLIEAFTHPEPRLALGSALGGVASAAIDVSDGLLADAGHIARASGVALHIQGDALPVPVALTQEGAPPEAARWIVSGGDDYELLFTAAASKHSHILDIAAQTATPCTRIGSVRAGEGVALHGERWEGIDATGYNHFD